MDTVKKHNDFVLNFFKNNTELLLSYKNDTIYIQIKDNKISDVLSINLVKELKINNKNLEIVEIEPSLIKSYTITKNHIECVIYKTHYFPEKENKNELCYLSFSYESASFIKLNSISKDISNDFLIYSVFFHDATIHKIVLHNSSVELWMNSSEIIDEFNLNPNIPLSKENYLCGILYLYGITSINIDSDQIDLTHFQFNELTDNDDITILDLFFLSSNCIRINYLIDNYKTNIHLYHELEISYTSLYWKNSPNLLKSLNKS